MKLTWSRWLRLTRSEWFLVLLIIVVLSCLALTMSTSHPVPSSRAISSSKAFAISQALYNYAKEHRGQYPEGRSSTEVFQVLLDRHYLWNPKCLYVNLPGKIPATSNQLKAENVGWDFTSGITASSPENLPVFFLTGYHFAYEGGARAVPEKARSFPWSLFTPNSREIGGFMIVYYQKEDFEIISSDKDGSIPNFIPADFDPKGKVYRQLTP